MEITVDCLDKMKDQTSIIDLNMKLLDLHNTEIKLELLLCMSALPAVLNGYATTYKRTTSATKHVILYPEIWSYKKVSEKMLIYHF